MVPPSHLVPDIPPELDRVVMRALAPNADARYQTAQQFRRELADAMPRAVALDASHLSELLGAVMDRQIARARAKLPASVMGIDLAKVGGGDLEAEEVLKTMTISATGVEFLDALSDESASAAEQTSPPFQTPPQGGTLVSAVPTPRPSSRKLLVGLLATSLVALALGVGLTILIASSNDHEPSVTPLPIASGSPPPEGGDAPESVDVAEPEVPSTPSEVGAGEEGEAEVTEAEPDAASPEVVAAETPPPTKTVRPSRHSGRMVRTQMMTSPMMTMSNTSPLVDDFGF